MILLIMMTDLGAILGGFAAYAATASLVWTLVGALSGATMAVLAGGALLHHIRTSDPDRKAHFRGAPTNP